MTEYPGHVPAMSAIATPIAPAPAAPRSRLVAAGAVGLAALLVPIASFLPLYTVSATPLDEERVTVSFTSWGFDHPDLDDTTVPVTGPLLVAATVLLLAAAALCAVAATRSATPGVRRLAGKVTAVGAAFLTGGVWTTAALIVSEAANVDESRYEDRVTSFEEGAGAGLWLLVAGVVVALVATVLTWRAPRPVDHGPATRWMPTPTG